MRAKRRQLRAPKRRRSARISVGQARKRYMSGLEAGYLEGKRIGYGSFGSLFDGTSIIIPSYNQAGFLQQCIDSISKYTDLPYEIIVVDNGSTDWTAEYLRKKSSQVRYRVLESNRGFAGAINVGMMMAKGTTMLLLNNDTIVTERWLDNLLKCLNSDPMIGMVGPVTNYIGGDQRIDVPYDKVDSMHDFARGYNVSDSGKWHPTDRLTGFCLLFRRDLWERTGYLDEGYTIGNFEDDDYNLRVRLQGYKLVIARDTFIHHFGSISMKALGEQIKEVNTRNQQFYTDKWNNAHDLMQQVMEMEKFGLLSPEGQTAHPLRNGETSFYPQGIAVRGISDVVFWIEEGIRRPVEGNLSLPVIRLSKVDMKRWPIGPVITASEAEAKWHGSPTESEINTASGWMTAGSDGALYYLERGKRRRFASRMAMETWGLHHKPVHAIAEAQLAMLPDGLPIISPVRLVQRL